MSGLGSPEFQFPELVKIFGLSVVRKASVTHLVSLRLLESSLSFHNSLLLSDSRCVDENLASDFKSLSLCVPDLSI